MIKGLGDFIVDGVKDEFGLGLGGFFDICKSIKCIVIDCVEVIIGFHLKGDDVCIEGLFTVLACFRLRLTSFF